MAATKARGDGDAHRWLEDDDAPRTWRWIGEQQSLYAAHLDTWPAHRFLSERIAAWLHHDEWSVPRLRGEREFATLLKAGADLPQVLWHDRAGSARRVIVDPVIDGGPGAVLDAWEPNPSGTLISFQISRDGREQGELIIRAVDGGRVVDGPITGVRYTPVAWVDDDHFFYLREAAATGPGTFRQRGVWLHRVGSSVADDELVFTPQGTRPTVVDLALEHGRWLVVSESHGSGNRNDLWIADLDRGGPSGPMFVPIHVDVDVETSVRVASDGWLYLLTTAAAPRRRLCRARCDEPDIERWTEVIPHDDHANLSDAALLHDGGRVVEILAVWRRLGFAELTVHSPDDGQRLRAVEIPSPGRIQHLALDQDGRGVHLAHAAINRPATVHRYRPGGHRVVPAARSELRESPPPLHRFERSYRSADGTTVPIVVLSSMPIGACQPRPTILHAYGSFGDERQFGFSATVLAWLELGGQYAVAYVRGGGDLGRDWHHQGMRRRKTNTIDDLLGAADWIVDHGLAGREQLCLSGGSAGGLLMLAAITQRPDVAAAAIASAPLADMARYEQLGIGALWRAEFGSAADPDDLAALLSYSPYHNVRAGVTYPAVLLTGFHGDTRAGAAHSRKMTAALQEANHGDRPILLRYEHDLGHGRKPRNRGVALAAEVHAFAAAHTGLQPAAATDHHEPGRR